MRRRIAILVLLMLMPAYVAAQFFPARVFSERPDLDELIVTWYSKHLSAMDEPSLWKLTDRRTAQSYRFTWLRTFHPPFVFRLDVLADGSASLTVKSTNGAGGYEPGLMVLNKTYKLSPGHIQRFVSALDELNFWSLPTKDLKHSGLDGAQWVFEGVKDGRYHVIDRWTPEDGPFRRLMLSLVDLGRVKVHPVY